MKRWMAALGLALATASCGLDLDGGLHRACSTESASCEPQLSVMTLNLYVGADVAQVLLAPSFEAVPARVTRVFGELQATDFPARAQKIADLIETARPALIGLQEAELVRIQSPGDYFLGNPRSASTVVYDYLQILVDELRARGLDYEVAVTHEGADIELPDSDGNDLRLTDREAILALRGEGLRVSNPIGRSYAVNLVLPIGGPGGPLAVVRRGFVSVEASYGGHDFRFVSTHLEPVIHPLEVPIQAAQAEELIRSLDGERGPTLLVGDFNTSAEFPFTTPTYLHLLFAGFQDLWWVGGRGPGATCCQDDSLRNPVSLLDQRIDLVLGRGLAEGLAVSLEVVGDARVDRTPSGLWVSDHAGVVAGFSLGEAAQPTRDTEVTTGIQAGGPGNAGGLAPMRMR